MHVWHMQWSENEKLYKLLHVSDISIIIACILRDKGLKRQKFVSIKWNKQQDLIFIFHLSMLLWLQQSVLRNKSIKYLQTDFECQGRADTEYSIGWWANAFVIIQTIHHILSDWQQHWRMCDATLRYRLVFKWDWKCRWLPTSHQGTLRLS